MASARSEERALGAVKKAHQLRGPVNLVDKTAVSLVVRTKSVYVGSMVEKVDSSARRKNKRLVSRLEHRDMKTTQVPFWKHAHRIHNKYECGSLDLSLPVYRRLSAALNSQSNHK